MAAVLAPFAAPYAHAMPHMTPGLPGGPPSPLWLHGGEVQPAISMYPMQWRDLEPSASMPLGSSPSVAACAEVPTVRSRAARKRARQKQCGATPPVVIPKPSQQRFGETTPPPRQSAAEVLELLASPPTVPQKTECPTGLPYAPPPVVFPTGGPLFNEKPVHLSVAYLEQVGESQERSSELLARFDSAGRVERSQLLADISKVTKTLALSKHGCRVVQKALEVASSADRDKLVAQLEPFVEELYDSPHGNHVLTKIIEVMPSATIGFVVAKFVGKGPAVARHRFGCRVLERLIEHCDETQIGPLIDEIVAESAAMCRHPYGNFVLQHLFEHSPQHRDPILDRMLNLLPELAGHRTASHVVQKVMDYSEEDSRQSIVDSLVKAESPNSLFDLACSRYGSFVVEQLADMSEAGDEVKRILADRFDELSQSPFGKRVLERFGLVNTDAATNAVGEP